MMPRNLLLACASALGLGASAQAPGTATDYFNLAARQYVKQDKGLALRTLDKGLRAHPGDARLLKLAEELLKEEQQKQQAQDQQQRDQQQGQQEQEQQPSGQDKEKGQQQQRQEQPAADRDSGNQGLSRKDAERLLDALDRKEQDTQEKVRNRMRPVRRVPIEKDW
jgi:hypothetical protein